MTSSPSVAPSGNPTITASLIPSLLPSTTPTASPSAVPTSSPSAVPTSSPSAIPTASPSAIPTISPTAIPTSSPSQSPSSRSTILPTVNPSNIPSVTTAPSENPTYIPSSYPSIHPTGPSNLPTYGTPTYGPSISPSEYPSSPPSMYPTISIPPSIGPTYSPTSPPTFIPSAIPSISPTVAPSVLMTSSPSVAPSGNPTITPSLIPSLLPSVQPSLPPTIRPTVTPSRIPSLLPTPQPTSQPSLAPSSIPTRIPSAVPTFTHNPSVNPTYSPSGTPSLEPSGPSYRPTYVPSGVPSIVPSLSPSEEPTAAPLSPPIIQFTTKITIKGLANGCASMTNATLAAFLSSQAKLMNVSESSLSYQGCSNSTRRLLLQSHNIKKYIQEMSYVLSTKVQVTLIITGNNNVSNAASQIFNQLTTVLSQAVSQGTLSQLIAAKVGNSSSFQVTGSSTGGLEITVFTYGPSSSPTFKPSYKPTISNSQVPNISPTFIPSVAKSPTSDNQLGALGISLICIFGFFILIFCCYLIYKAGRNYSKNNSKNLAKIYFEDIEASNELDKKRQDNENRVVKISNDDSVVNNDKHPQHFNKKDDNEDLVIMSKLNVKPKPNQNISKPDKSDVEEYMEPSPSWTNTSQKALIVEESHPSSVKQIKNSISEEPLEPSEPLEIFKDENRYNDNIQRLYDFEDDNESVGSVETFTSPVAIMNAINQKSKKSDKKDKSKKKKYLTNDSNISEVVDKDDPSPLYQNRVLPLIDDFDEVDDNRSGGSMESITSPVSILNAISQSQKWKNV